MTQSDETKVLNIKFTGVTVNPIRNDYEGHITLEVKGESRTADFVANIEEVYALSNEKETWNFNTLLININEEWLKLVKSNTLPVLI